MSYNHIINKQLFSKYEINLSCSIRVCNKNKIRHFLPVTTRISPKTKTSVIIILAQFLSNPSQSSIKVKYKM